MKYRRADNKVLQAEVEAGLALLESDSNTYFLLNSSGALVWSELESDKSLDELSEAVASHFRISVTVCKPDVKQLLEDLSAKNLIVAIENDGF